MAVRQAPSVRVDVGTRRDGIRKTYEYQEMQVDSLGESPNFPAIITAFWGLRLLRPILVAVAFAGGPQDEDGAATAAITLNWMASITGILGAIVISSPFRELLKQQGSSPWFTWRLEPAALVLFSIAVVFDLLHQLLATIGWKYFWGTGMDPDENKDMLSVALILLHVLGLISLLAMLAAYGRCFRASWRKFDRGPPAGYGNDHQSYPARVDLEEGLKQGTAAPTGRSRGTSIPQDPQVVGGPRQAANAGQPPNASEGPPKANSVGSANVSSPSSPRAWLWIDPEWLPVRIMRTSPDGAVIVRLPGGSLVSTTQAFLRPRVGIDEQPPGRPPSANKESASSARAQPNEPHREEHRRSSWSAGQASSGDFNMGFPRRPNSAPPGPSKSEDNNEGAKWASERLVRLRQELQGLEGNSSSERRSKLRKLQRELHPDKQPPELRVYAQPLFMLVQREWELDEAATKAAANTTN